jgi:hypothetical protein
MYNTNVFSSTHRALSESARLLCNTMFNYPDWKQYWEDLFYPKTVYTGLGDRSLLPRGPKNIGYFLTIPSCPADGYPAGDPHDPGKYIFVNFNIRKLYIMTYPLTICSYFFIRSCLLRCSCALKVFDREAFSSHYCEKCNFLQEQLHSDDVCCRSSLCGQMQGSQS